MQRHTNLEVPQPENHFLAMYLHREGKLNSGNVADRTRDDFQDATNVPTSCDYMRRRNHSLKMSIFANFDYNTDHCPKPLSQCFVILLWAASFFARVTFDFQIVFAHAVRLHNPGPGLH
jgi:hypothetical protein